MRYLLLLVAVAVLGCSTKPTDLQSSTPAVTREYQANYQEIYRRVSGTAKRCYAGIINSSAAMTVDSELFSELGYGEIQLSLINYGVRNYYWTAKIERMTKGTKMTLHAGNTIAPQVHINNAIRWADGDENCFG
jgi:hypothetical protein